MNSQLRDSGRSLRERMNSSLEFFTPNRRLKEFHLLSLIGRNPHISQHRIAREIGVSSAMTNAYIKDFVAKGYVENRGETNRSMGYFLTPSGKRVRRELLHFYSREVARLYTATRMEYEKILMAWFRQGIRNVVIFGAATTGELVLHAAGRTQVRVLGIVDNDPEKQGKPFGSLSVSSPSDISTLAPDGVIIAAFGRPEEIYKEIRHLKDRGIAILRL